MAVDVVPGEGEAAVEGADPVGRDSEEASECVDEVLWLREPCRLT